MAHLAESRRLAVLKKQPNASPSFGCSSFSACHGNAGGSQPIHRCRQMPSPVDTLLACFVRGEGRGMNIKSRGHHSACVRALTAVVAATLPVVAEAQDSVCGTQTLRCRQV